MTFKIDWEKTSQQVHIKPETITSMVAEAFPNAPLLSYEIVTQGCDNINIKIILENGTFNLRIYLRDKGAAYREMQIAGIMRFDIPIPETLFVGDQIQGSTTYRFAITQFMEGTPLRDLLLNYPEEIWRDVMLDVGTLLSEFRRLSFSQAGFFDEHFDIPKPFQPNDLTSYIEACLSNSQVKETLGDAVFQQLRDIFQTHRHLLPDESEAILVHGDFDPANILVHQIDGKWRISAILDWEFAFSGSYLWDVANMLRYAHKMPASYQESFIQGLEQEGIELPDNWRSTIALLNISSLLDILMRHPIHESPILRQDIYQLIQHHSKQLI